MVGVGVNDPVHSIAAAPMDQTASKTMISASTTGLIERVMVASRTSGAIAISTPAIPTHRRQLGEAASAIDQLSSPSAWIPSATLVKAWIMADSITSAPAKVPAHDDAPPMHLVPRIGVTKPSSVPGMKMRTVDSP